MAKKAKKDTAKPETKVTKVKAVDSSPKVKKKTNQKSANDSSAAAKSKSDDSKKKKFPNPLAPIGRYFKGSWSELKQVRWPTRRATWGMTTAVLIYTAVFVTFIIFLDMGFSKLLEIIIG